MLYVKTFEFCLYILVGIGFYYMIAMCFQTIFDKSVFLNEDPSMHWINKQKLIHLKWKQTFVKGLFILLTISIYLMNPLPFYNFRNLMVVLLVSVIMIVDLLTMRIPNTIVICGLNFALFFLFFNGLFLQHAVGDYFFGFLTGGALLFALAFLTNTLGGGDVKLMALLGLFLGFKLILWIIMGSFLLAGIGGIILIILSKKKRKDYIPFGPFIALATFIILYFNP